VIHEYNLNNLLSEILVQQTAEHVERKSASVMAYYLL